MAKPKRAQIDPALMQGKRIVITGANAGIGLATAEACAAQGATVVMACRRVDAATAAANAIRAHQPSAQLQVVEVDLTRADMVAACAQTILATNSTVDVLINNAGGLIGPFQQMFDMNVAGHLYLTELLLPSLLRVGGKVINISSEGHRSAIVPAPTESIADLLRSNRGSALNQYGFTKLCNIWHAVGLHQRYHAAGLRTYALHPGAIRTAGWDKPQDLSLLTKLAIWVVKNFLTTADLSVGAQTPLHCIANATANGESGLYYDNCAVVAAKHGDDQRRIDELLTVSLAYAKLLGGAPEA